MGETYERLLAGADKVSDPAHPLYIADDFQFHGKYEEEQYLMASYFDDGSHALSLLGKKMISASRRLLTATKVHFTLVPSGCPPLSCVLKFSTLGSFQDCMTL